MVLAELSAPCSKGVTHCFALESVRMDRSGQTMLSWRERLPSDATGVHMGLLASGASVLRRGQISSSADDPFRVLLAAPNQYSVLLKAWGTTWRGFLADFSTVPGAPVFSEKLSTGLTDEQVRNFTAILSRSDISADNELTTFTWGASPGAINLGGGIQGYVAALPALLGYTKTKPIRERVLPYLGYTDATVQWMGSNELGQAFSTIVMRDAIGAYSGAGFMNGDPRPGLVDVPGCRNDTPGFPSVTGAVPGWYGARVIWLEANDSGTGCDMHVEYAVLNPRINHVSKVVSMQAWTISEQQALNDPGGPPSVFVNQFNTRTYTWSGFTKPSQLPVSRLLGQATQLGWIAIVWQECDGMSHTATCTTYMTKTNSLTTWDLKQTKVSMAAGSSDPVVSINASGDAIVAWVEPTAPCAQNAARQCAQLKAQRF